jgi:outer membrane protein OmpA-like peptidoglycan-associated protein
MNRDCDDIWYSDRNTDGTWNEPINVGPPLNTPDCDVLFSISPDGRTALVGGEYEFGVKRPGFSITKWDGVAWSIPQKIFIPNFYNRSGYFYANLSADGTVLLMGLEREDTKGSLDLYFSLKDKTGAWTAPKTLGDVVNSAGFDVSPFLALDGKTLYYSSDGLGGYGKADLFMTRRLDDTWQNWSKPINLGETINTAADEHSISLNAAGDTACIVSSDSLNELEGIYFVCLPTEVRPQKVNLEKIVLDSPRELQTSKKIYFQLNEHTLSASNQEILQNLLLELKNAKEVVITGYADDIGTDTYNIHLSKQRALAVRSFLVKHKIKSIKVIANGEKALKDIIPTEIERKENRRVDIELQYFLRKR